MSIYTQTLLFTLAALALVIPLLGRPSSRATSAESAATASTGWRNPRPKPDSLGAPAFEI